jgi:probable HAF family extracellular repeat protein
MKTTRSLTVAILAILCSLTALAQKKDPKIIIRGVGGGGAPTLATCPPDGCPPVGVDFTFTVNHNGGVPLLFNNASGQNWTALTLTETGVPADQVTCVQTLYLSCAVNQQENGSVQIVLSGLKGLNLRNGILAGANFSIGFNCVLKSCWPKGLSFGAHADTAFRVVDFPGAIHTYAYGINNAGDIVGAYFDSSERTHGFLLSNGVYSTIDFPDSTLSVAAGLNNLGDITGQYNDSSGIGHGFVYSNGQFSTKDLAGEGYQTFPTAIDDFGDLVGFCTDSSSNYHGCVAFNGPFSLFDYPGATATLALGISFDGFRIVGGFGNVNGVSFEHGYLFEDGYSQIDFPGNTLTIAFGVNKSGEIVGTYSVSPSNTNNGFLLTSGTFTQENVPGAVNTNPSGRNDVGQVVGWFTDSSQISHGYVTSH